MKQLKKSTVAGAFLLATSPAWANSKTGTAPAAPGNTGAAPQKSPPTRTGSKPNIPGKSQEVMEQPSNRDRGELDIFSVKPHKDDKDKLQSCKVPKVDMTTITEHLSSFAFEPKKKHTITLTWGVDQIRPGREERVLLLLYSPCLSDQPQTKMDHSMQQKLALDSSDIQVFEIYRFDAAEKQSEFADDAPKLLRFYIDVEPEKLAEQVEGGNNKFYFQAALLKKTDFDNNKYENTISFSQPAALHFTTTKTCPNEAQFSSQIKAENASCEYPTKTQ